MGFQWHNCYYFDVVLPMGLQSAAMACQCITSAIHRNPNGGRLGKASVREHENEAGEDRIENVQKSVW